MMARVEVKEEVKAKEEVKEKEEVRDEAGEEVGEGKKEAATALGEVLRGGCGGEVEEGEMEGEAARGDGRAPAPSASLAPSSRFFDPPSDQEEDVGPGDAQGDPLPGIPSSPWCSVLDALD